MQDIRQSEKYAQFMERIGWIVEKIDGVSIFIKKFPLVGATIKIQRADTLPSIEKIYKLKEKYRARLISVEPNFGYVLPNSYKLQTSPFLPTKTIYIDLAVSESMMFKRFTEAKQRAVRRAQKETVQIIQTDIKAFIQLKNKTAGLFGFLTTTTLKPLWKTLSPDQITVLSTSKNTASILLLFYKEVAYYWMAAANQNGKKTFAPTLLIWEGLKLAKQKGCTVFDFEGIYDERYPELNKNWLGFTKFKQGFGGEELEYPQPFLIT